MLLLRFDDNLQSLAAAHLFECLMVLFNLVYVRYLKHATVRTSDYEIPNRALTIPLTLIFPLSRYATARGKQWA